MSKPDLTPIRERLEALKQASEAANPVSEPLWQQSRSLELPPTQPSPHPPHLADTVQALRQRAEPSHLASVPDNYEEPKHSSTLPAAVTLHWQRLQQEAAVINDLSEKQAIALHNFKRSADRLAWSLRKQPSEAGLDVFQFFELQETLIPQVNQTASGKITLTSTPVDLHQDERYASQTAEEIRALSQARSQGIQPRHPISDLAVLDTIGATLSRLWRVLTSTLETRSQITALDIALWFGGGLISRLALELLLAASPSLWPLLVGAMVGLVGLALYRLLLTPQPDIAFVVRLFLALGGLALGGQI